MTNQRGITVIVPGKNGRRRDVRVPIDVEKPTPPWLFDRLMAKGELEPNKKYLVAGNSTMFLRSDETLQIFEPDPRVQLDGHCGAYRTAPDLAP